MKVIIKESQYNRMIDSYISFLLEPHEIKPDEENLDSIYWVKDGKAIVEIERSNIFWLHIDIWENISRMFNLDYSETQSVIKTWLEQHSNLKESIPFPI